MKTAFFLIGILPALFLSSPSFASDTAFSDEVYDSVRSPEVLQREADTGSVCMNDYRVLRNHYAIQSGLAPFVGLSGVVGSAAFAFGYEYGGWTALHSVLGEAGYVLASYVIPMGVLAGYVGYQSYEIMSFIQAERSYRLIRDVHGLGNGKALAKFTRHLQKKHPEWTEETVRAAILAFDADGSLCDGTRVHGYRKARYKWQKKHRGHRVAWTHDIEKDLNAR